MIVRQRHTVRSRVAAWCGLLAVVSGLLVLAGHLLAQQTLEANLRERMEERATTLQEAAAVGGMAGLVATLRGYERQGLRTYSYRVTAADGTVHYGPHDLPLFHRGWQVIGLPDMDDGSLDRSLVYTAPLADAATLSVIADTDYIEWFDNVVIALLLASTATLFLLAVIGGVYLDRVVSHRLSSVKTVAAALARIPDFGQRVPISPRQDEFDALAAVFNAMLDRIGALMAENARVTGYVAHDLRAPLVRLAELVADARDADGEARAALLARVEQDVAAVLGLFDAFLAIGQRDASGGGRDEPVDLSAMLVDLVDSFAVVATASGRVLLAAVDPGIAVRGDEALVSQLVVNLIENAIRHTPRGTRITLSLTAIGDHAHLLVIDNGGSGAGTPDADALAPNRQRLGLKIVQAIAQSHGGTFAFVRNDTGATAQAVMPLARAPGSAAGDDGQA